VKPLLEWRDKAIVAGLAERIRKVSGCSTIRIMEVCGGHTAAIYRFGLHRIVPDNVQFVHGPGCPVCVTANDFIDRAVALAQHPDITIATFGDLIRVPGSTRSLTDARAAGADVQVFYSSADALDYANNHPDRTVVFLAIGFETTACTLAATLSAAVNQDVMNFKMLSSMKTMPEALLILLNDPDTAVDGLILPGHVVTVTGIEPFRFIAEKLHIPCVVSGFEPIDLAQSALTLCEQIVLGRSSLEIQYTRIAKAQGNLRARELMNQMLKPAAASWRGFGIIENSGLAIRDEFSQWDAMAIAAEVEPLREHKGCRCGDVLRGRIQPSECALFGNICTPEQPRGACMVSAEGACAAVFSFAGVENE
jgi:hydrogenase expression/formation protein HypD